VERPGAQHRAITGKPAQDRLARNGDLCGDRDMRLSFLRFWPGLTAVLLTAIQALHAATFSANPVADAFVTTGPSNDLRDNNYGFAGALSIAAPGSDKGEFQSVLKFDLSGARASFDALFGPGQWMVLSVSLQLNATSPNNALFNANAAGNFNVSWMQNDSWLEGPGSPAVPSTVGISYNSLANTFVNGASDQTLGTFSYDGGAGLASRSLTVSSGLLTDIQAGAIASLRLFAANASVSYLVNSRNFGAVANRPLLTVEAVVVPEPGPLALLFTFVGALGAMRVFRQKR
jgi:hypothetical protein